MFVEPQGFVAAEHIHPSQTEHFLVHDGELCLQKLGEQHKYRAGQEAAIPPGVPHVWWNSGSSELHVTVELRPADRFDAFLTSLFALAQDGKTNEQGMPSVLQIAVMMKKYDDVIYPRRPPRLLQKALFAVLAPIARRFGYRADYPYPEYADQ
jgi:oxalate decarboxylase/phosphoglucose isomerase-like protein (cupin superfamily)